MARTPSQNDALRIAVDAAMALTYIGVMATALVEEAPHEYLGLALFALVATHVTLSRRWFRSLGRGRYDAVRILELATLAGLIACLVAQMASSLVVSKHALAFLPALPGAAVARRTHMLCSYWGFVFAFCARRAQPQRSARTSGSTARAKRYHHLGLPHSLRRDSMLRCLVLRPAQFDRLPHGPGGLRLR